MCMFECMFTCINEGGIGCEEQCESSFIQNFRLLNISTRITKCRALSRANSKGIYIYIYIYLSSLTTSHTQTKAKPKNKTNTSCPVCHPLKSLMQVPTFSLSSHQGHDASDKCSDHWISHG